MAFDQKPVGALAALAVTAEAYEHPCTLQFLAHKREFEFAFAQARCWVAIRGPEAAVPEHDGAAAILALRDGALEVPVIERVILGLYGEALVAGVKRWALGDRP